MSATIYTVLGLSLDVSFIGCPNDAYSSGIGVKRTSTMGEVLTVKHPLSIKYVMVNGAY